MHLKLAGFLFLSSFTTWCSVLAAVSLLLACCVRSVLVCAFFVVYVSDLLIVFVFFQVLDRITKLTILSNLI